MVLMWIKCEDKMPEVGQKLWYYFDVVGSHRGTFDGYYVDQIRIGFVSGDQSNPLENVSEVILSLAFMFPRTSSFSLGEAVPIPT